MFTMNNFKIKGIFGHTALFKRQTLLCPWFCARGVQYYPWSYGLWFSVIKSHGTDPISIEYDVYEVANYVKVESNGETNSEGDDDISKTQERAVNEVLTETFPHLSERGVKEFTNLSKTYCDDEPDPKTLEDIVVSDINSDKLCPKTWSPSVNGIVGNNDSESSIDELRSELQEQDLDELLWNSTSDDDGLIRQDVHEVLGDNNSDEHCLKSPERDVIEVLENNNSDGHGDEFRLGSEYRYMNEILGYHNSDELYLKSQEQDVDELSGNNNSGEVSLKQQDVNEVLGDNNSDEHCLKSEEVLGNSNSDELGLKLEDAKEILIDNNSDELCLRSQERDVDEVLGNNNSDKLCLKPQELNEVLGDSRLNSQEREATQVSGNNNSDSLGDQIRLKSQERDVKGVLRNNNSDGRGDECRLNSQERDVNEISGNNNSDSLGDQLRRKSQERDVKGVLRNNNSDGRGDECLFKSQERNVNVLGDDNGNYINLKPQGVNEVLRDNNSDEHCLKSEEVLGNDNRDELGLKPQDVNAVLRDNNSDEHCLKSEEVLGNNNSDEHGLKPQDESEVLRDNKSESCSDELGLKLRKRGINSVSSVVGNVLTLPSKTTAVVLSDDNADFHDELDPIQREQTMNGVLSACSCNQGNERAVDDVSGNTDGEYEQEFNPKVQNRAISDYDDMLYIKSQDRYANGKLNYSKKFGSESQKRDRNDVDSEHSGNYELSERVEKGATGSDNGVCSDDTVPYSLERIVSRAGNVNSSGYGDNIVPYMPERYVSEVASINGYHEKPACNLSDHSYSDSAYSSDPKISEAVGANSNSYEYDPISLKRGNEEGKISKQSVNKRITVTKIYYHPSVSYSDVNKVVRTSGKCAVKRRLARTHSTSLPSKLSEHCRSFADVMNVTSPVKHSSMDDSDDTSISEELSPVALPSQSQLSKSASPSPVVNTRKTSGGSVSSGDWPPGPEEDIEILVIHQSRHSLSSLGSASPEPLSESTPTLPRAVPTSAESEPESTGAELRHIFSRRSSAPPRSDSLASVYSGAGEGRYGTVAVRGEVEFGLQYNYKAGALEILVKQCRDLAPVDLKRNRSDPYVKVYLLPDKSKSGKRKTKVKKHTLNPVFDETLKFHMTLHGLETRTLWLTVWHSDMFGRNDFLGEVMMPLENKVFDDPTPQWYPLQERTEPFDDLLSYKGDIIIGLKFVPPDVTVQKKGKRSRGSLHVLVKEAKNLIAVKANGTSDPFCKSYLLPDKGRSSKQKTPVLRRSCNPVWNCTFVYEDVSLQELSERSLELTVWDHDRLASNEFLGGLRFNLGTGKHYGKGVDWMDATGKEVTLWQSMLERPNFWVEGCLTLRPSLEQHRTS